MNQITKLLQKAWCRYRNMEYVEGHVRPLPSDNFEKGYLMGHEDTLRTLWVAIDKWEDEPPCDCVVLVCDLDGMSEMRLCSWDGENFYDKSDDSVVRPYKVMCVPSTNASFNPPKEPEISDDDLYKYYKSIKLRPDNGKRWSDLYPHYVYLTGRAIMAPHPHRHFTFEEFVEELRADNSMLRDFLLKRMEGSDKTEVNG